MKAFVGEDWLYAASRGPDETMRAAATARQAQLTKPPGALGRLESCAIALAALQARERPRVDDIAITVFAGDHGICAEGISAFPQSVTAAMIGNFLSGGAAISVAARALGARLAIVDLGTAAGNVGDPAQVSDGISVTRCALGVGTANFAEMPAMTETQCHAALRAGRDACIKAADAGVELFIGGEMGIGNTTSATALASGLLRLAPIALAGPGTGLDDAGVAHKVTVVERALARHDIAFDAPLSMLRCFGGFEIAALVGAYLTAAQRGVPVLVDGFICTVAALIAVRIRPDAAPWLLYAHSSAEPGHRRVLSALNAVPLLDMGMRLGEASGAAVAVPVLRMACALHGEMATFAEAGVADGS